jgi:hypothetical protein
MLPLIFQGAVIGIDEFYFHRSRELPLWERVGHPLDTLSLLLCVGLVLLAPYSEGLSKVYLSLAIFSCLLITKDEFVHAEKCRPSENWLHALLFILHPLVLIDLGWLWLNADRFGWIHSIFVGEFVLVSAFLFYQITYWNVLRDERLGNQ